MGQLYDAVVSFLREDETRFTADPERGTIRMGFTGENGKFDCLFVVREEMDLCVFYSRCPILVPDRLRLAAAEFIVRANYGMPFGNFEMDLSDGEVRFKTAIDTGGEPLTAAYVKPLMYANLVIIDHYLPGILSVCYGNASASEAIEALERRS